MKRLILNFNPAVAELKRIFGTVTETEDRYVIPNFFDDVAETFKHPPTLKQMAALEDWIKWRVPPGFDIESDRKGRLVFSIPKDMADTNIGALKEKDIVQRPSAKDIEEILKNAKDAPVNKNITAAANLKRSLEQLRSIFTNENVVYHPNAESVEIKTGIDSYAMNELKEYLEEVRFPQHMLIADMDKKHPKISIWIDRDTLADPDAADMLRSIEGVPQNFTSYAQEEKVPEKTPEEKTAEREDFILARLNRTSGQTGVKWKIVEGEHGKAVTTKQAVAQPRKVIEALSLLLDVALIQPPSGAGFPTIPLARLDRPDIARKLAGLDLSKHLQSASADREK
jgi:hypothetical protein